MVCLDEITPNHLDEMKTLFKAMNETAASGAKLVQEALTQCGNYVRLSDDYEDGKINKENGERIKAQYQSIIQDYRLGMMKLLIGLNSEITSIENKLFEKMDCNG